MCAYEVGFSPFLTFSVAFKNAILYEVYTYLYNVVHLIIIMEMFVAKKLSAQVQFCGRKLSV